MKYETKDALGCLLILIAILAGLYTGVWWALIGGIVLIVESVKVEPASAFGIAFGIARVILAAPIGWFTFFIGIGIATMFFETKSYWRR